jgi:hypothetical protein
VKNARLLLALLLVVYVALGLAGCPAKDEPPEPSPRSHPLGMVNVPPLINPSWGGQVLSPDAGGPLTYYIDPQGAVALCSDTTNTGLTSASPLCSWHELHDHIWACGAGMGYGGQACPRFTQNVTVVYNSAPTSNYRDPIYFSPVLESGAVVTLQCNLGTTQLAFSGATLNSVTAKNRSTPTVLKSTLSVVDGGSVGAGLLALNTYAPTDGGATHVSRAWTYQSSSNTLSFSQPLPTPTMPMGLGGYSAENNTWAAGDTVQFYQPISIDLVRFTPTVAHQTTTATNFAAYLYQCNVYDPTAPFSDAGAYGPNTVTLNHEVSVIDSSFNKAVNVVGESVAPVDWQNVYIGQLQAASVPSQLVFAGGVLGTQAGSSVSSLSNVLLDADVILGGSGATYLQGTVNTSGAGAQLGLVYVDTSSTLGISAGLVYANGVYSGAPVIWGPGTLNVTGQSRLRYPAGSGKAAATFTLSTLQLNGQANLTLSASQLDTTLGTTIAAGCGFNPGGGGYCNGGY